MFRKQIPKQMIIYSIIKQEINADHQIFPLRNVVYLCVNATKKKKKNKSSAVVIYMISHQSIWIINYLNHM